MLHWTDMFESTKKIMIDICTRLYFQTHMSGGLFNNFVIL